MVRVNVGENFKMTMEVHTMIIKKFGSIIVAAALIVTVFSGCGSKAPEPTPSASPSPEVSATPTVSPSASPEGETDETPESTGTQATETKKPSSAPTKNPATQQPAATPTKAPEKTPDPTKAPEPSVSVSELMNKMVSALPADSHNMSEIPSDLYAGVYQIDPSAFDQVLVYGSMMNVKANEMIVIKAKNSANLNEAKSALSNRLATLKEQWKNYLPDQYEIVKAGTVTTKGLYAALVIAQDGQKAVSAFNSAVK